MKKYRSRQIADLIAHEIADLIITEASDVRFYHVTITGADVSNDLRYAKIYVSILGDEDQRLPVLEGLNRAIGFFKKRLSERLKIRFIPQIRFEYDDSLERGNRIIADLEKLDDLYHPLDEHDSGRNCCS